MLSDKKAACAHKTNNSVSSGQVSGRQVFFKIYIVSLPDLIPNQKPLSPEKRYANHHAHH
jgi:hypothetical protein